MPRELGVIGCGRLGTSLAMALNNAGERVTAVSSRSEVSAAGLAGRLERATATDAAGVVRRCDIIILTVPDDALCALVADLEFREGQWVLHCSGALGLAVLEPARARGALTGCMHPLQAFSEPFRPTRFRDIFFGVDGDAEVLPWLIEACQRLGCRVIHLSGSNRSAYHAAAVIVSNYVVALYCAAIQAWALAGLPTDCARDALLPMTHGAVDSLSRLPLHLALTGPISRGDVGTVTAHISALQAMPSLATLYKQLGSTLLELPLQISQRHRSILEASLSESCHVAAGADSGSRPEPF